MRISEITTSNSIIEKPRILRENMNPFFLRGVCPRPALKQKLFLARIPLAISGLSLASFIACYAEGGRFRHGKAAG
jgi:hypothetical protein